MNDVSFDIDLSPEAKALLVKLGSREGMGMAIARAMDDENIVTVGEIKKKLSVAAASRKGKRQAGSSYPYPMMRTRRLRNSIGNTKAVVIQNPGTIRVESAVGSGTGQGTDAVRYAAIHEFGGTINIPSRPRKGTKLAGKAFGKPVYRSRKTGKFQSATKAYSITIPARSYIRPTIKAQRPRYSARVSRYLMSYLNGRNN